MAILVALVAFYCTDGGAASDNAATSGSGPGSTGTVVFVMESATVLHHWQALAAIPAGDIEDARHHIEHIISAVSDDALHMEAMSAALVALNACTLNDAEHEIEGMLAGHARILPAVHAAPHRHAARGLPARTPQQLTAPMDEMTARTHDAA